MSLGPPHTWDWEPVTITFQALSLVEKVELVQARFTLHSSDQRSMWMQDGCKIYRDSYRASNGLGFMVTWTSFKNHLLEVGLNTKPGDHDTPNTHKCWFILFYHVWGPTWIEIHWKSIWLRAQSHMTSHYTWGLVITLHDFGSVVRWCLDTYFGLSQFPRHGSWLMCEVTLILKKRFRVSLTIVSVKWKLHCIFLISIYIYIYMLNDKSVFGVITVVVTTFSYLILVFS